MIRGQAGKVLLKGVLGRNPDRRHIERNYSRWAAADRLVALSSSSCRCITIVVAPSSRLPHHHRQVVAPSSSLHHHHGCRIIIVMSLRHHRGRVIIATASSSSLHHVVIGRQARRSPRSTALAERADLRAHSHFPLFSGCSTEEHMPSLETPRSTALAERADALADSYIGQA